MNTPPQITSLSLATLRTRWPQTEFHTEFHADIFGVHEWVIFWDDGPTESAIIDHIHEHPEDIHGVSHLSFSRTLSLVAWACLRASELPETRETTLSPEELQDKIRPGGLRMIGPQAALSDLHKDRDLTDLAALAGGPRTRTQAEIAARLGQDAGTGLSLEAFDLWLVHGGWALAGMLTGSAPS